MKKIVATMTVAAMLLSLLAGCSGGSISSSAAAGGESTAPTSAATAGGDRAIKDTINIALAYDISSLDPHIGKEMRACIISQQIFDTLVEWDPEGGIGSKIVPCLATSWEWLSDTSIQFKLREGVKFQDGNEMTAGDVKYSFERCMASKQVGYNATWMKSVEVVDDHTVIVNTNEPYGPLLAALTITPFSIVSKAACEADPDNFGSKPIGTGRYKLVKYTSGEGAVLEAFEDCWRGAPKTKTLDMRIVTEATQRTILLETGEADIAYEVLPNDVSRITENNDLKLSTADGTKCYMINFNCKSDGPVGNKLVRQAIELAINKEELVDTVLYGYGTAAYNVLGGNNVGYQEPAARSQDIEKAKQLLADAGYPGGGFTLNMWLDTSNVWLQYAQIIQASLDQIGITVNIETMESSTLNKRENSELDNYDMGVRFMNSLTGDARFTLYNLLYSTSSSNYAHWENATADELIMKGRATQNIEDAKDIYTELYALISDEMPVLPLYYDQILVGLNANVEGFVPRGDGIHVYGGDVVCYE